MAPLVKNHLIQTNSIIIDAKSGTSGAGRSAKLDTHYPEFYDAFKAYGVATHRHTPEIEAALGKLNGSPIMLNFTPHLVPMSRGILATAYANLNEGVTPDAVSQAFETTYATEPFVRLLGLNAIQTLNMYAVPTSLTLPGILTNEPDASSSSAPSIIL